MSEAPARSEILGLDLHAKLFQRGKEWVRIGPLQINLWRGNHLEIVSNNDEALGCLLDILTLRDSNWLGSIRIHGCAMSGLSTNNPGSFGLAVLGPSAVPAGTTVSSVIQARDPNVESPVEIFRETIPLDTRVSSLDPISRERLNLWAIWKTRASLVLVDGRYPIFPKNRTLAGRVIGSLMIRGCSLVALSPENGVELTPHAPRVHVPVGRIHDERALPALQPNMMTSWVI